MSEIEVLENVEVLKTSKVRKIAEVNIRSQQKTFPCTFPGCLRTYLSPQTLCRHLHFHTRPFRNLCHECGKCFLEFSGLKRHQLVHSCEKAHHCPFDGCQQRFSLKGNIVTHARTHTKERPFVCPFDNCGKTYTQKANLKMHILTHADPWCDVTVTRVFRKCPTT